METLKKTGTGIINKQNLRALAKYSMLPGILPRIRGLGFHFGHFAYLIALVFSSARLIPQTHPVLRPANIGRFGVRQVIAIAANNLTWSKNNIDQIAIFSAIVIGLIMVFIQVGLIALYAIMGGEAQASSASFFETPAANVQTDVVLIFLDQVFGANLDIFGAASEPRGTPVYLGLQKVLALYSMATMVIAVIIVLYYILTVIGEAAKTGTPFGQRFNSLWAPIRLVVALGLLVPLGSGLNSAQYVTLWIAKMGSGLGTQAWIEFTKNVTSVNDIVSKPASASTTALVSRIFLSEVCAAAYDQIEEDNPRKITILQSLGTTSQAVNFGSATSMIDAAKHAGMSAVDISWSNRSGTGNASDYTCGHITVSLADFDFFSDTGISEQRDDSYWEWIWGGRDLGTKIGQIHSDVRAAYIQEIGNIAQSVRPAAKAIAEYKISVNPKAGLGKKATLTSAGIPAILKQAATQAHTNINTKITSSYESISGSEFAKSGAYDEMIKRGWGAAGLWYGNIGKINQKYMEAINAAAPTLGTIFTATEVINPGTVARVTSFFGGIFGASRFGLASSETAELEGALSLADSEYANNILSGTPPNSPLFKEARLESAHADSESAFVGGLLYLLGGGDIYSLKNNPSLDPMARLMGAGHTMVNRSLISFGIGSALGIGGSIASASPKAKFLGELAGAAAGIFFAIATIGLVAGIFLAYIIPLLPFIYFAFAVIGWILEIFEAVVAMPLWALAHLRIDGDGMPGQAAIAGYQLLLMILMRPALIILGLVGGYIIFGAAMFFFSTLFNSATVITQQDISGSSIGAIGVFVYTIIFAFLAYNIATMCFKMIDDVPKGILRWMGASAQPFGDSRGDPVGGSREMIIGAVAGATAMSSGMKSTSSGIQKARERQRIRKDGGDPDNPIGRVQIMGGGSGGPGSTGGPSTPSSSGGASTTSSTGGGGNSGQSHAEKHQAREERSQQARDNKPKKI